MKQLAFFAVFDGSEDNGLTAFIFPETYAHIWDIGAGQRMLWALSMGKSERIICA